LTSDCISTRAPAAPTDNTNGPDASIGSLTDCAGPRKPLCVNLDGTLIRTSLLTEGLLSLASQRNGLSKLWRISTSHAGLEHVGAHANVNMATIPYNEEFLAVLREQKANGRRIVLATAADVRMAQAIADHLGLFDEVIASDGTSDLKGRAKARELVRRFSYKGFDYAGNSRADLAVWRQADQIILVNASPRLVSKARAIGPVIGEFDRPRAILPAALEAMRPYQWVKNLLVFVPIVAARSFLDLPGLIGALCVFISFSATASGIYLINDLFDLEADRAHPRKRLRPLASGALAPGLAVVLAIVLVMLGGALAVAAGAATLVAAYALISVSYSVLLKRFPLIDIFILAALYTLRVIAGGVASGHRATLWLLAFSGFTFLSLALVKRTGELVEVRHERGEAFMTRRGYRTSDIGLLETFGVASAFASSVVLALFISSTASVQPYWSSELLWLCVPLILFWQLRLWLATDRGQMQDDPILYALKDWVSWLVGACTIASVLLASWDLRLW
jgi:4-hydroxybenzoate polyprenyltransferase